MHVCNSKTLRLTFGEFAFAVHVLSFHRRSRPNMRFRQALNVDFTGVNILRKLLSRRYLIFSTNRLSLIAENILRRMLIRGPGINLRDQQVGGRRVKRISGHWRCTYRSIPAEIWPATRTVRMPYKDYFNISLIKSHQSNITWAYFAGPDTA